MALVWPGDADDMDGGHRVSIKWVALDALDGSLIKQSFALWKRNCSGSLVAKWRDSGWDWLAKRGLLSSRCPSVDLYRDCRRNGNDWGCDLFGSISSVFFRGRGETRHGKSNDISFGSVSMVPFTPKRGTYAYDVLQREFKELDKDGAGYITEGELKVALKRLNLPASEQDVQAFIRQVVDTNGTNTITFEQFAEYAIVRENKLVDTFRELDKRKNGYITVSELKAALGKYNFRTSSENLMNMVSKMHMKRGVSCSPKAFDFAEFRNFLMLSTANDLRDTFEIWGRAAIDLGDVDTSFPMSSGRYNKTGRLGQRRPKVQVLKHLFVGSVSAAVSRTAVAPLERMKIMSMVNPAVANLGFSALFNKIWREEGTRGLFKGNLLNVLQIAPVKAVEFAVYNNIKDMVLNKSARVDVNGVDRMVLGTVASIVGTFVTYPLDTIRSIVAGQASGPPHSIIGVTRSIIENDGFFGLYRGLGPNMLRIAPYGAINFYVYNWLKQWYRKNTGPGGQLGILATVLFGSISGAAAQTAVYPLEMVQRRLQFQAACQGPAIYKNMIDALHVIVHKEGFGALYAGLIPNYLKLVPAAAISFLVYESLKEKLGQN
eukprot:c20870_g1_i1 orf=360-2165(-)